MLPKETLRKADVVTAIVLIALGAAVVVGASQMPMRGTYGGVVSTWYVSPAVFPLIVGGGLIVLAAIILVRAIREGGLEGLGGFIRRGLRGIFVKRTVRRGLATWLWIGVYIAMLALHPFGWVRGGLRRLTFMRSGLTRFCLQAEGVNYVISSFLFLLVFMLMFYRPKDRRPGWKRVMLLAGLSAVMSFLMGYVFSEHLAVPLP